MEAEPEEEVDYEEEETFEEENDIDESVEILVPDFDCPDAGFYPSPSNCGQYYQCTADKTVLITDSLTTYSQIRWCSVFIARRFQFVDSRCRQDFLT